MTNGVTLPHCVWGESEVGVFPFYVILCYFFLITHSVWCCRRKRSLSVICFGSRYFCFYPKCFSAAIMWCHLLRISICLINEIFVPLPWQPPVVPPTLPMAPPSPSTNNSSSSSSTTGWEQLSKTNLYIRGLPPGTTDHDLVKLCQPWVFAFMWWQSHQWCQLESWIYIQPNKHSFCSGVRFCSTAGLVSVNSWNVCDCQN